MEITKIDKKTRRCLSSSDEKMEMHEEDENRRVDCLGL